MSDSRFNWKDRAHPSDGERVRAMAVSGGYVMVRRPRAAPFVLSENEWARLPLFTSSTRAPEGDNLSGGDGG